MHGHLYIILKESIKYIPFLGTGMMMYGFIFLSRKWATDKERFNRFFHAMLDRGVYLAPALYEAGFVSAAHTAADIDATLTAAREAFTALN